MATSCVPAAAAADVCANCGQEGGGGDGVKLKNCTACLLVKYCSVDCQKAHRKQHKKACKKRAAELKDERLYSQGHERPEAEICPICTQPVPIPTFKHSCINACCTQRVCHGCQFAANKRGIADKCAFCRTPTHDDDAEVISSVRARVEKKDPKAIKFLGDQYFQGSRGLERNESRAVELWNEADELGSVDACFNLGLAYDGGRGVEQDAARGVRYYEKAAMMGNVAARWNLGAHECNLGNYDRAVRHLLISAKMGDKDSLKDIKELLKAGHATTSQYAEALREYQDASEEMKSPDRDEAKKVFNN